MAAVAPEKSEEMERMVAPPIVANLTFGGIMYTQGGVGMLCNPMGMISLDKCIQACLCPDALQAAFAYVDGKYSEGFQVDTKPAGCCGGPHFTVSLKDYSQVEDQPNMLQKVAIEQMRKTGVTDAKLAIAFPKTTVVGKSKDKKAGGAGGVWGVVDADGAKKFNIKSGCDCGKQLCGTPLTDNCKKGIAKGNMCMNFRNPVFDPDGNKIAVVVQTVPLIPTGPCCADMGPTVQMRIEKADANTQLSKEDIARLALFMFAVKPNMGPPGGLPKGGPVYFVGQILPAMMLGKIGWALGYGMKGVEQEYIGFKGFFNGEAAGIGDFLEKIRSNF